jgi:hypothetical protein
MLLLCVYFFFSCCLIARGPWLFKEAPCSLQMGISCGTAAVWVAGERERSNERKEEEEEEEEEEQGGRVAEGR